MRRLSLIQIILSFLFLLPTAFGAENDVNSNFSSYYDYSLVIDKGQSPDKIARSFVKDPVQGRILMERKTTRNDFQKVLDAYSKAHPGVQFRNPISENEFLNLLKEQENRSSKNVELSSPRQINQDRKNSEHSTLQEFKELPGCVSGQNHPFYGNYKLDQHHKTNFLDNFDPNKIPKLISKNPQAYADVLKPRDPSIPYNAEQVMKGKDFNMDKDGFGALNMNADLGLQHTIENILYPDVLTQKDGQGREKPSFVIVSSGHAIAGLASLAKLSTESSTGKKVCLFDTSIYMPMGTWQDTPRMNVATQGSAIWAQSIANSKKKCDSYAGGVAVALNGHRGDLDLKNVDTNAANINAQKAFGSPDEFVKKLKNKGLNRVVVITETMVKNPSQANKLPLEILKEGDDSTFNEANKDLYDFLKSVKDKGIEVVVVSGEQRVDNCNFNSSVKPTRHNQSSEGVN